VRYVGPLPCNFLCRALSSVVAVNQIFAVRSCLCLPWPKSLPCVFLRAHGKEIFAVRKHTAKMQCTATAFFSRSVCNSWCRLASWCSWGLLEHVDYKRENFHLLVTRDYIFFALSLTSCVESKLTVNLTTVWLQKLRAHNIQTNENVLLGKKICWPRCWYNMSTNWCIRVDFVYQWHCFYVWILVWIIKNGPYILVPYAKYCLNRRWLSATLSKVSLTTRFCFSNFPYDD
jgi:hypothetical protein